MFWSLGLKATGNVIIYVKLARTYLKYLDTGEGSIQFIRMTGKLHGGAKEQLPGSMGTIIKLLRTKIAIMN